MYFIGVDLGTSAVKLLLMDEEGKIVNIVSREYPLYFPHPGWSEQKPEDWWEQSKEGIRELVKDVDKSQVAGISFGGQMHGLVILDENDNVIRPAILWNDGRTAKQTDYLNTVIGKEKLSEYTANIAFAGFTAPKILWVKENEPDNFAKICKIMLPKDYLAYRLSGAFVSDYSDASGMLLMDVKNKCWSKEMAEICGISLEMLPELHESFDAVGTLKPEVAAELGLPETCKVVAGAGDNAAAAVGTGTVGDGMCNVSLGTSGTVFISSSKFGVDSHNALHAFAHADGHYHLMGCMLSAASCNKWWMDEIIRTKEYTKEQENITKLGENNVFFLPYLMGERSPHNNPDAYERPSLLRAMMLETGENDEKDTIWKLECNIDDCTGEALGYCMGKLLQAGARDVHYIPVYMKKNRPAYQLDVICEEEKRETLESIIFTETTTIGIRRCQMERTVMKREFATITTEYGDAAVKICRHGEIEKVYPE